MSVHAVPPRRAAFVDRDGTLVRDVHYLARPEQLELVPGAAAAVRRLNAALVPVVIVTNQSGIARGYFTAADYLTVERELVAMLARDGAHVLASYHCPHHPSVTGPCDCRKPGSALFERAARAHALDLGASLYVGDRWRDVAPALRFGGLGVLVPSADTPAGERDRAGREARVCDTLDEAVDAFLRG